MTKQIKAMCVMFLACFLLGALTINVHAEEQVSGNNLQKALWLSEEEFKQQLRDAINECKENPNETSTSSIPSFSIIEEPESAAALIPDVYPSPGYASGTHIDWVDRAGLLWEADYFYERMETAVTHPQYVFLIDPEKDAVEVDLTYIDAYGNEKEGTARTVSLAEVSYSSKNEEDLIDGFYEEFYKVYSDFLVAYEAFLIDHPEVFWLNGDLTLCFPEIYVDKPDYYGQSYYIRGYFEFLLVQYDEDGNKIYDVRLPQYQNVDVLKAAIAERDQLIKSIINPVKNKTTLEQLTYFNWYLTHKNELNVYHTTEAALQKLYSTNPDSFNCMSALRGTVGPNGPTEEAYAYAFHALCKEAEIPATVAVGKVGLLNNKRDGIWNLVQIKDKWQAVNCAWNDLTSKKGLAVSGDESEMFFLSGMNTEVVVDGETILFGLAHSERNVLFTGFEYKNGPVIAPQAYLHPVKEIKLSTTANGFMYGYEEAPTITAEAIPSGSSSASPVYSWVLVAPNGQETVIASAKTSITFPEVTEPGIYRIRSIVAIDSEIKSKEIEIEVTLFKDVKETDWFFNAIDWSIKNGVTYGLNNRSFGPYVSCTRAQIVTFLWRAAGSPAPVNTVNNFKDVKESDYFYKATLWAVENKILSGYTADMFAPNVACTRAEMVTFLWREAGRPEVEDKVHPFKDVTGNGFYYEAMLWAVEEGIAKGYTADMFAPNVTVTRSETVTFLYRADGNANRPEKNEGPSKILEGKELMEGNSALYTISNDYIESNNLEQLLIYENHLLAWGNPVENEAILAILDMVTGEPIQERIFLDVQFPNVQICDEMIVFSDGATGKAFILDGGLQILKEIESIAQECAIIFNSDATKMYAVTSEDGILVKDLKTDEETVLFEEATDIEFNRHSGNMLSILYSLTDTKEDTNNAVIDLETGEILIPPFEELYANVQYFNDIWLGFSFDEHRYHMGIKDEVFGIVSEENAPVVNILCETAHLLTTQNESEGSKNIALYDMDGKFISKCTITGEQMYFFDPVMLEKDGGYYTIFVDNSTGKSTVAFWDLSVAVDGDNLQLEVVE